MLSRRSDAIRNSSAAPSFLSSSFLPVLGEAPPRLELDQNLDRFAVIHCAIAAGHVIELTDPIEDATRLDTAFENVR